MPFGKAKEPKAPKEKKEKKVKPPKEKKPKKPKKSKKGEGPVEETAEVTEENEAGKKKKKKLNPIFLLVSLAVIVVAAVIIYFVVLPKVTGKDEDPEPSVSVEPDPPVLPTELPVGDNVVPGMVLGSDEYQAQAVLAKTITYTYTDLADAGKVAETYVSQLRSAETPFSVVDEEFVRTDAPDFTTAEGMVLLARTLPLPEPEATESEAPEESESAESEDPAQSEDPGESENPEESAQPTQAPEAEEPVRMVLTVRITWSEGQCVVTADEEEGMVTSPPREPTSGNSGSLSVRGAQARLEAMTPEELGLSGESMEEYNVFPIDGVEMVDGVACITLYVYSDGGEGGNEFMGSYLMSIDGAHLYRVNPVNDAIEILK